MAKKQSDFVQGSLFEEDYLLRTLGQIVTSNEIALTELVANAWDAGATEVNIFIPEDNNELLVIEDNGMGLTKEEFHFRWMRLGYNRLKHQGDKVIFPSGNQGKRFAYGRNGVGRHGLLCFNNEYKVITQCKGKKSTFTITTQSESEPFVIKEEHFEKATSHGTRLEVIVKKNLPKVEKILNVISARFLHDPKFKISINRQTVPLEEHSGLIDTKEISIDEIKLKIHFIDSQKAAKSTLYQGIAFWQGGRLVGEPSWLLGDILVIDGRTRYAKRYTVVVETSDLALFIKEDWSGFKKSSKMIQVYECVAHHVGEMFKKVAKETIEETKEQIKNDFANDYEKLSPLAKYEFNEVIESISISHPTAKSETVSIAVEAIINLEKTRTGKELLLKLSSFSEDDIAGINDLLNKWTIKDALTVLDEIDNRVSVIEAIKKLSGDKDIDELHILHPLVTNARWLFGPEFDSPEFVSNTQLHNAVEKIFKTKIQKNAFSNHKKRPDIVILSNSTLSVTSTETINSDTGLSQINKILLLELKRGGSKLSRDERNQAQGYVEDFINAGNIIGHPYIDCFVIGEEFSEKVSAITIVLNDNKVEMGKIRISTFGQLVDTAEKRLFGLRQKLGERYDDIPGINIFNALSSTQLNLNLKKAVF